MADLIPEAREPDDTSCIEYRGRDLPEGMTTACFVALEKLFVEFDRDEFQGFASDAAIRAFVISHTLQA